MALVRYGQSFSYGKYLAQCDQAAYLRARAWAQHYVQGVWAMARKDLRLSAEVEGEQMGKACLLQDNRDAGPLMD
jgi:hypothetical protein